MRVFARCWFLMGVLVPCAILAQEPDGQRRAAPRDVRVARLIRQLGSESYEERRRATEALSKFGPESKEQLEQAAAADDPEVRLRAAALLKQLKIEELWAPRLVRLQYKEEMAAKVVADLAEQSGNRLLIGDQYGTFHDAPVTLDYPSAPFWQVLDEVCRQSENHVRTHYDTRNPGLVVVSGRPGKYPVAYAGPVRAEITSARRVFSEELDYEDLDSEKTHTFQLQLRLMWEDRFALVAYRSQPELIEAVTDSGVQLSALQPSGSGWNVANRGTHQVSMECRLHPPPTTAQKLDVLRLKWGLVAVGDMATVEVDELATKAPHFQDDVELVVEGVQESPGGRCEVSLLVNRDLVIPDPQEILFHENEVELLDQHGRPFRKQGQNNNLTDRGARIRVSFAGQDADSRPTRLKFHYSRIRSRHDLEIVFRDVPLPRARPE